MQINVHQYHNKQVKISAKTVKLANTNKSDTHTHTHEKVMSLIYEIYNSERDDNVLYLRPTEPKFSKCFIIQIHISALNVAKYKYK